MSLALMKCQFGAGSKLLVEWWCLCLGLCAGCAEYWQSVIFVTCSSMSGERPRPQSVNSGLCHWKWHFAVTTSTVTVALPVEDHLDVDDSPAPTTAPSSHRT